MTAPSRRQLAKYAVDQLLSGESPKKVALRLGAVLIETRRVHESELLLTDIMWELEKRGQLAQAAVTTATPLTEKLRRELRSFIKKSANVEQVALQEKVDKKIIGGIRVETAVRAWDKTVARSLADIREAF